MREVTKEEFLNALQYGDIGICQGRSLFAKLQNWFRKRREEGVEEKASHGFFMKDSPNISEADGWKVNGANKINRYFTGHHKVWIFRTTNMTKGSLAILQSYIKGAEDSCGRYAWGGIVEYVKSFFSKKYTMKDKAGVVCTEYTTNGNISAHIPFITPRYISKALNKKLDTIRDQYAHLVTPSLQLDWILDEGIPEKKWWQIGIYENKKFYLA